MINEIQPLLQLFTFSETYNYKALSSNVDKYNIMECINNAEIWIAGCDNNMITSCNNGDKYEIINNENDLSNGMRHVVADNIKVSNNCDKQSEKRTAINATFFLDNDGNDETVNSGINANNSTIYGNSDDIYDSDRSSTLSFDRESNNICNSTMITNTSINDINHFETDAISPCDDNCDIMDSNFINGDNFNKNATFLCDDSGNNAADVLNDDNIFYDNGNNSNILNNVTYDKTSMGNNNNMILPCNDDNNTDDSINQSTNISDTSEYLCSTSNVTTVLEYMEHESTHNNISTNNDNSSKSLMDISSIKTFGCREDNLSIPFSEPKGLQKKNFCYYCKKFQSKIARHLENMHKSEPEVKKFLLLSKGK